MDGGVEGGVASEKVGCRTSDNTSPYDTVSLLIPDCDEFQLTDYHDVSWSRVI
jgi:hypothetical protein